MCDDYDQTTASELSDGEAANTRRKRAKSNWFGDEFVTGPTGNLWSAVNM